MRIKDIINYIRLETFSGTVIRVGTTTHSFKDEPERQVTCLDVTICSDSDPSKTFLYKIGILEFLDCFKENSIAVGDGLIIRKYPLQTIWSVKQHVRVYEMDSNEKDAVNYLMDCGIKELNYRARMRRFEYGSNDLTALQLETHTLRAILVKTKLHVKLN